MFVTVVSNLFPPEVLGGYELLAKDICLKLRERGHDVRVLTTGNGQTADNVTRSLRLARSFGSAPRRDRARHWYAAFHNRRAAQRWLSENGRPDVVLAMSQRRLGLEALRVFQERAIPIVYTVNDDWPVAYASPITQNLKQKIASLVDRGPLARHTFRGLEVKHVVYLSDAIRGYVREHLSNFPEGIIRWQGVDLGHFSPRPFRAIETPIKLLFVGRLHPTKAPDMALRVLGKLQEMGVEASLSLAGAADDPHFDAKLHDLARPFGARVKWLGKVPRDNLPDVYRASDIFLFLSQWNEEAMGLTYLEAMACGVPVVAHPAGGAKDFLDKHPVAERVSSFSENEAATAIIKLAKNPNGQRDLVGRALAAVQEHASLDAYVRGLEQYLEEVAGTAVR